MRHVLTVLCILLAGGAAAQAKLGKRIPVDADEAKKLQKKAASDLGIPLEKTIALDSDTNMEFVLIPAGEFHMGSLDGEYKRDKDEGPLHHVKISKPFYMGKHEVTQLQYKLVMGAPKKCKFTGDNLPLDNTSWQEATYFLKKLSNQQDLNFRLPTEAEWEYACRAGTTTPFYVGETIDGKQANYDSRHLYRDEVKGPYMGMTTDVGSYPPNPCRGGAGNWVNFFDPFLK